MAHALNLEVVAEGVETPAVAALLRDMGYDYAQGYLYSPALTADKLAEWLRDFRNQRPAENEPATRAGEPAKVLSL